MRVDEKEKSEGVRVYHEKKSDGVRVKPVSYTHLTLPTKLEV